MRSSPDHPTHATLSCAGASRAMSRIAMSRGVLYDLFWAKPPVAVARNLGISSVALGKLCAQRNVPNEAPAGLLGEVAGR